MKVKFVLEVGLTHFEEIRFFEDYESEEYINDQLDEWVDSQVDRSYDILE